MNEYRIYFEIYGKKMKTTIQARSLSDAKDKLKSKLKILKVEKLPNFTDELAQEFKDFFGI